MGNSSTKESRSGDNPDAPSGRQNDGRGEPGRSRNRISRGDLSGLLHFQSSSRDRDRDRQNVPFERRETKQEREARRLERERASRLKERERSMRQEQVDGGFLVTMGVYTGIEDFSKPVVRQLQIERKLAPFWRGLNDWSASWAEHQLVAAARGLPVPAADAAPDPELVPRPPPSEPGPSQNMSSLTVPIGARTLSTASDRSESAVGSGLPSPGAAAPARPSSFKPRAKALAAALSVSSRNTSSIDLAPREVSLPYDPFVNGQPIEVFLYKDAAECPICFMAYPPYLNRTRCCAQPICSECFVQIKRADPHLPERHADGQTRAPNQEPDPEDPPEMLISEPSQCPYCQLPECGVTYEPPPFRRGLVYSTPASAFASTAMSSQSSLNSTLGPPSQAGRRRTHSLSATAANVITTDRIRPDWASKLAAARAHQARRAAAATALHTAAFLVGGGDQRSLLRPGRFGRRNTGGNGTDTPGLEHGGSSSGNADGGRRSQMEELEEMMFMEAVRLSIATEEERKRKEEKSQRKEAKKREQAERKAHKKKGQDPYGGGVSGASGSSLSLGLGRLRGNSAASGSRAEAMAQASSQPPGCEETPLAEQGDKDDAAGGKGKGVDRGPSEAVGPGGSSAGCLAIPAGMARVGSHLRQMSTASSLGSSPADSPSGSYGGQGFLGPEGSGSPWLGSRVDDGDRDMASEPMFNFRSLAELVGVNIEDGTPRRGEGESSGDRPLGDKEAPARALSQVREEGKEEAEAEHVEENRPAGNAATQTTATTTTTTATEAARDGGGHSPEVTVTPGTPTDIVRGGDARDAGATVASAGVTLAGETAGRAEDGSGRAAGKTLGHSSVTEQPSSVAQ